MSLLPPTHVPLSLTGGEPTLRADALIGLLEHCKQAGPELVDIPACCRTAAATLTRPSPAATRPSVSRTVTERSIPVLLADLACTTSSSRPTRAFDETLHGILNLASASARRWRSGSSSSGTRFPYSPTWRRSSCGTSRSSLRSALMGLEMTRLAQPIRRCVGANAADYQRELAEPWRLS